MRLRATACLLASVIGAAYLVYRVTGTLNPAALWFAVPLFAAEVYGFVSSVLYFFTAWDTRPRHEWRPAPEGLSVDVMVPSYNEPLWVVRRTLVGALAIEYPHETYLLDDGHRPEMRRLARELGARYLTRAGNQGAKAGNLNAAIARTRGDFIVVFDADHVPLPEFLDRTLGYFGDPTVAFVQTPQEFYNVESFQHLTRHERKRNWHQQQLFYRVLQPGKDRWNSAFFCGSCGIMRRAALDEVGGFATETITEDMHTSFRLHARGWSSAYHNEVLALGLAAQTAAPYHLQRLRWGQGTMQLVREERLLTNRNLTIAQRLNYFSSVMHYFDGYQRLLLYLSPSLAVATGILPIRALTIPFALWLIAYYAASMAAFKLTGRGYAMFVATERFHMIGFYTYIRSSVGLWARGRLHFSVSPKAAIGGADARLVRPMLAVTAYAVACFAGGLVRVGLGRDGNTAAFVINTLWSTWIVGLAILATLSTMRSNDFRSTPRAHAGLPVRWRLGRVEGVGVLADVSEGGAALVLPRAVRAGDRVRFELMWSGLAFSGSGTVRRVTPTAAGTLVGLQWPEVRGRSAITLARLAIALTSRRFLLDYNRPPDRIGQLDLVRGYRRAHARLPLAVPLRLGVAEDAPWAVTEDVSPQGALVLAPVAALRGTTLEVTRWDGRPVTAEVVRCDPVHLPPGPAWRLGLRVSTTLAVAGHARVKPAASLVAAA